ncbi:MAG: hypothetical protein JW810_05210, partial [Sedimentisphaerales bacterium]|nr:hypothetical protein [Sedimentisphaerales bacterium]
MRIHIPARRLLATGFILSALQMALADPIPIYHVKSAIENGSPCSWELDEEGRVVVHLLADQQRSSVNRQTTHWHFQIQARPGSAFTLIIDRPYDVYNGRLVQKVFETTTSSISADGNTWRVIEGKGLSPGQVQYDITMETDVLHVARIQPYTLRDLQSLLDRISDCDHITVSTIGKTVEGRPLEIITVGNPAAPHRVLLRARCHPWESGGNWVIEGLLDRLCQADDRLGDYLATYCLYIMPMANKDGVARGMTRCNVNG